MSKRARPTSTATSGRRAKRPIDKKMMRVLFTDLNTTQQNLDLYPAASFPGTLTGIRWSIGAVAEAGASPTQLSWLIVVVPAGTTVGTVNMANGDSAYDPEQNVIAFGSTALLTTATHAQWDGTTKGMRKLKAGDKLVFTARSIATQEITLCGTVQFFYKT